MRLSDIVKQSFLAGAVATAGVGAGVVTLSVPAVAEAKQLEELTPQNFSAKVYHNPKPVVVLFYEADTDLKNNGSLEYSRRMEQVVEALADKYEGQVAFFRVAIDHDNLSRESAERVFGVPDTSPLTAMYGRFDVLNGRQEAHNFKIDVSKGGPVRDESIPSWIKQYSFWIDINLIGSNKPYTARWNGDNLEKVYKSQ